MNDTQVTFRSGKLPPYEGEEEQIKSGIWGKRLAEYLVENLDGSGIPPEEIVAGDWGWAIPIENEGFRLAICCGHQDGDEDEFLCFTAPATLIVMKLFRKIDATGQICRPVAAIAEILAADPEIRDVERS